MLGRVERECRSQRIGAQVLVLFGSEEALTFRGIYLRDPEAGVAEKIFGLGPNEIGESEIVSFYKYNSGRKTFQKIRSESLTSTTDAIAISKEKIIRVVDDEGDEVELGMDY